MKVPSPIRFSQKQDVYIFSFLILVSVLLFLPFMTTFNDLLTRFVMSLDGYSYIQDYVVPAEVRMVAVVLSPFGLKPYVLGEYLAIGAQNPFLIEIAWNCVGWQSLLFFLLTSVVGLQGDRYTNWSKFKAWMIGLQVIVIINILRISLVSLSAYYFGQTAATVIHDYGSTLTVIGTLFVFWWFSYRYVLEERNMEVEKEPDKV